MPLPSLRSRSRLTLVTLSALPVGLLVWAGAHWMSAGTPKQRMVTEVIPTPGGSVALAPGGVAAPSTATIVATAAASTESLQPDTDDKPWRASGTVGAALTGAEAATVAAAQTVPLISRGDGSHAAVQPADKTELQGATAFSAQPSDASPMDTLPVHARHMVVMDDSGQVLAAKEPDAVVPIASLTKLMTAMVVLDARQDPQEELTIDDDDVDRLKHSKSRVRVGARLTRADALEMALIASENRAASALARHFPGGLAAFESAVQAKIRALGLTHTTLNDPTGLSPANLSTASEVARIAMAAARYPDIVRITSVKSSTVEISGRDRELRNTNHLVGAKGWDIRLSKTGFTNEAGRCLVMRLKQGIRTLTVVLLDTDGSAQRLQDASLIRRTLSGEPAQAERAAPARKHHKVRLS
ncbi:serine hydrolase [Roseateles terrae]|uniref:D-alanyl-D-alanine carboxypeptidase n=1 Tax=Roseateles terrae TaxID=431060 RepID=A0ABR6GN82_9BURK|nr:serine hydrolase [Roseateles terrae]MBB3193583.1 D-alanyl-D-alanine carboxypeptidase [Roseateles terrae]